MEAGYSEHSFSNGVPEGGNKLGVCAEPKAATAAHYNQIPITGMDPCKTCEVYEKEYMEYANSNEKNANKISRR